MGKYEEALERAKQGLPIEEVFPELKESEDERIRKRLVEYFNGFYDRFSSRNNVNVHWEGLEVKAVIAYLEKQKEQKPTNLGKPKEWSEEDEKMLSDCIEAVGSMSVRSDVKTLRDWLKSLRPQPHWKPSEEQMKWLKDVIETVPMTCRQQVPLESLYNDLKKL